MKKSILFFLLLLTTVSFSQNAFNKVDIGEVPGTGGAHMIRQYCGHQPFLAITPLDSLGIPKFESKIIVPYNEWYVDSTGVETEFLKKHRTKKTYIIVNKDSTTHLVSDWINNIINGQSLLEAVSTKINYVLSILPQNVPNNYVIQE